MSSPYVPFQPAFPAPNAGSSPAASPPGGPELQEPSLRPMRREQGLLMAAEQS